MSEHLPELSEVDQARAEAKFLRVALAALMAHYDPDGVLPTHLTVPIESFQAARFMLARADEVSHHADGAA